MSRPSPSYTSSGMKDCHPGIPPYEEPSKAEQLEATTDRPAARVLRMKDRNAVATQEEEPIPPVVGEIIERIPTLGSIRPPGPPRIVSSTSSRESNSRMDPLKEEINRENERILAAMTADEIEEERKQLLNSLPPKLIDKWSRPR